VQPCGHVLVSRPMQGCEQLSRVKQGLTVGSLYQALRSVAFASQLWPGWFTLPLSAPCTLPMRHGMHFALLQKLICLWLSMHGMQQRPLCQRCLHALE
jgi:hypothetical protein